MQVHSLRCSHCLPTLPLHCSSKPSAHSHPAPPVSICSLWGRKGVIRPDKTSRGHLILVLPFKRPLVGKRKVVSYLPNADSSPKEKEVVPSAMDPIIKTPVGMPESNVVRMSGAAGRIGLDPFRGKPGSVSFCGLTHQMVEEMKLVSSPFRDGTGSFFWILGPLALILSLLLPQIFLGYGMELFVRDEIFAEILSSISSEVIFYAGLAAFLSITDHVQRPYLEFSPKRWSLITGLRGYLSSAFFTMGFKVFAPLLVAYTVWPALGLPSVIVVAPFLLGCAVQYAFEMHLEKRRSSCWPLLPIIFELYRLYQLNKGAHFVERLMYPLRGAPMTAALKERSEALIAMLVVLQILGIVCLWSLTTFLLRLFPSRPVAENY